MCYLVVINMIRVDNSIHLNTTSENLAVIVVKSEGNGKNSDSQTPIRS